MMIKNAALDPEIKASKITAIEGKNLQLDLLVIIQLNIQPAIDKRYVPKAGGSKVTEEILFNNESVLASVKGK